MSDTLMVRLTTEERAYERSVYSVDHILDVGCLVRLAVWGTWPLYEIVAKEDGDVYVMAPAKQVDVSR